MRIQIQLTQPIHIAVDGDRIEVELMTIEPCSVLHYNLYADVKTIVTASVFELKKQMGEELGNDNETSTTDTPEGFPLDIFAGANKLEELSKAINKYLTHYAKFDNVQVKEGMIRKLSIKDYNTILERVSYFLYNL